MKESVHYTNYDHAVHVSHFSHTQLLEQATGSQMNILLHSLHHQLLTSQSILPGLTAQSCSKVFSLETPCENITKEIYHTNILPCDTTNSLLPEETNFIADVFRCKFHPSNHQNNHLVSKKTYGIS